MDDTSRLNLCFSVIKTPLFICSTEKKKLKAILDELHYIRISTSTIYPIVIIEYNGQSIKVLACFLEGRIFYLAEHSNYEGFILFTENIKPLAVVIKFYRVNRNENEKEKKQVIDSLMNKEGKYI